MTRRNRRSDRNISHGDPYGYGLKQHSEQDCKRPIKIRSSSVAVNFVWSSQVSSQPRLCGRFSEEPPTCGPGGPAQGLPVWKLANQLSSRKVHREVKFRATEVKGMRGEGGSHVGSFRLDPSSISICFFPPLRNMDCAMMFVHQSRMRTGISMTNHNDER